MFLINLKQRSKNVFKSCTKFKMIALIIALLVLSPMIYSTVHWFFMVIWYAFDGVETEQWFADNACHLDKHPWRVDERQRSEKDVKIAVLTFADDFAGVPYRIMTTQNKQRYSDLWGLDLIALNPSDANFKEIMLETGDDMMWMKFELVRRYLPKYDYLLFLDSDALFKDSYVSIYGLIAEMRLRNEFLAVSSDLYGVNAGAFLIKNSKLGKLFLDEARRMKAFIQAEDKKSPLMIWREQEMFHFLLNIWPTARAWKGGDKPVYDYYTLFLNHTAHLERCIFQQILLSWSEQRHLEFSENAFIVHCVGHNKMQCVQEQLLLVK